MVGRSRDMKLLVMVSLILTVCNFKEAESSISIPSVTSILGKLGAWKSGAHATFYGGSDASRTMGKSSQ